MGLGVLSSLNESNLLVANVCQKPVSMTDANGKNLSIGSADEDIVCSGGHCLSVTCLVVNKQQMTFM